MRPTSTVSSEERAYVVLICLCVAILSSWCTASVQGRCQQVTLACCVQVCVHAVAGAGPCSYRTSSEFVICGRNTDPQWNTALSAARARMFGTTELLAERCEAAQAVSKFVDHDGFLYKLHVGCGYTPDGAQAACCWFCLVSAARLGPAAGGVHKHKINRGSLLPKVACFACSCVL